MKQLRRIKGINFNYDLPDVIYIVGLDDKETPLIQKADVVGLTTTKLLKLKQAVEVKGISKMHWDGVRKSYQKKTIPHKTLSDNPERGYVFTDERLAIARIGHLRKVLENQGVEIMSRVASIAARHDNYLREYFNNKKTNKGEGSG
jgi:hypothetical protein